MTKNELAESWRVIESGLRRSADALGDLLEAGKGASYVRADGQPTRVLLRRQIAGRILAVEWVPPHGYTRAELSYMRAHKGGDGAVTLTLGRLVAGWYW